MTMDKNIDVTLTVNGQQVSRGVPAQRIGVAGRSAPAAGGADSPRLDILIGERSRAAP